MEFPFVVPGYEHVPLSLRLPLGAFKGPTITYQGEPLPRRKAGEFSLTFSDGSELVLSLKKRGLNLFVPDVVCNGETLAVVPPLPGYQTFLMYLPLVLLFVGGGIGGFLGAVAVISNLRVFYGNRSVPVKILLSLLSCVIAAVVWLVLAVIIQLLIVRH